MFIFLAIAALAGAGGTAYVMSGPSDTPITAPERSKSRQWWGKVLIVLGLGGVWIWTRRKK